MSRTKQTVEQQVAFVEGVIEEGLDNERLGRMYESILDTLKKERDHQK